MLRRPRRTITLTITVAAEVPVVIRSVRSVVRNILQNAFGIKFVRCTTKVMTIPTGLYTQSFKTGIFRNVVVYQLQLLLLLSLRPLLETL